MSQDHFSANLDEDQPHDDRTIDVEEHEHEPRETEPTPKSKRKIPASAWIIGVVVLFMVGGVGYKKLTHRSAPNSTTAQVSELPPDNGGGMMPSVPQQSANVSVAPLPPEPLPETRPTGTQAITTQQQPATPAQADSLTPLPSTPAATAVAALAASVGSTGQVASVADATPAPHASGQNDAASASVPAATPIFLASAAAAAQSPAASEPDAKDKEIARLRKQLRDLKAGGHGARTARSTAKAHSQHVDTADATDADVTVASAVPVKAAKRVSKRHNRIEVQLGYHIKQVIPGQGWVEDESSGKQIVVAIGDRIGGAEVTKIDADASKIYTTAGVIQ